MSLIISMVEQGSDEWKKLRMGIPTSSNFDQIITTKGEVSKTAVKYMRKLAAERVSGTSEDGYVNDAMKRGIALEPEAIAFYELTQKVKVDRVGFCYEEGKYGCSPDGLVGEDGMIQIKCPTAPVHIEYLQSNIFPMDYFQQVQGELYVMNRKWSDFIAYYPGLKWLKIRVMRDEPFIQKLHFALKTFGTQLDRLVGEIQPDA